MKIWFRAILISATLLFTSCYVQLVGTYPKANRVAYSSYTFDETWSKAVDFFAMSGIPISIIDKQSGVIMSQNVSFLNSYTKEVNGKPQNPNAYVVIPSFLQMGRLSITGSFNVRVKNVGGYVQVGVNVVNLSCTHSVTTNGEYGPRTYVDVIPILSTGVFENRLLNYLGCY